MNKKDRKKISEIYFYKNNLLSRGWKKEQIEEYLGECDEEIGVAPNIEKLYLKHKILKVENSYITTSNNIKRENIKKIKELKYKELIYKIEKHNNDWKITYLNNYKKSILNISSIGNIEIQKNIINIPYVTTIYDILNISIKTNDPLKTIIFKIEDIIKEYKDSILDILNPYIEIFNSLDIEKIKLHLKNKKDIKELNKIVDCSILRIEIYKIAKDNNISFIYLDSFKILKNIDRKITYVYGPTNSGKTHWAINEAINAGDAMYLGPLRLLALEIKDRFTENGIDCDLITGEEVIKVDGSKYSARTIEMADLETVHSVVIIDEAQFVLDRDRGFSWVNAIVGCNAKHLILTGTKWAKDIIKKLADIIEVPIEFKEMKRMGSLEFKTYDNWKTIPDNSIVVTFSKKMVLEIAEIYKSIGRQPAIIYGALSPEIRREQAKLFRSGERKLLISTDAIGYGLNLPANNIVFWESEKYDGIEYRKLNPIEIQQIGGRAGRGFDSIGIVYTLGKYDKKTINKGLQLEINIDIPDKFFVYPTIEHLKLISSKLNNSLSLSLSFFENELNIDINFISVISQEVYNLAEHLDDVVDDMPIETKWILSKCPIGNNDFCISYWDDIVDACYRETEIPIPNINDKDLENCEKSIKLLELYLWVSLRFPRLAINIDECKEYIKNINVKILTFLNNKKGLTGKRVICSNCGKALLPFTHYDLCYSCHQECKIYDCEWNDENY